MPSGLEKQLEEERRKKELEEQGKVSPPAVVTPSQEFADTEAKIKAFKSKQDLQSLELGYENFKLRESSLSDKEQELRDKEATLQKSIGAFELEQKDRVEKVNKKAEEYNEQFNLLKTEREEAKRIMAEAIKIKADADRVLKNQTDKDKDYQGKQEAYASNMADAMDVVSGMIKTLRKQEDSRCLTMAVTLNSHLVLIQWLQYRKLNLSSMADVIAVDCQFVTELCEPLQSKDGYAGVTNYLLECVDWLENSLLIEQKNSV